MAGEKSHGRWHTPAHGKRIVYLAEHPAVALIEVLVHLKGQAQFFPTKFQLIKVKVADQVSIRALFLEELPPDWRANKRQTESIGNDWLAGHSSALLVVPSIPSPESLNYLLNPLHPDARGVEKQWCKWITYDRRLFELGAASAGGAG